MTVIRASRYHDISCGHRVVGHEGKCRNLHGHNYRIHFTCEAKALDELGRVVDFGVIKRTLCEWLEENWDHKMLLWEEDPLGPEIQKLDPTVVFLPYNPTAENLAEYLLKNVAFFLLPEGVGCVSVRIEETRKCSVEVLRD